MQRFSSMELRNPGISRQTPRVSQTMRLLLPNRKVSVPDGLFICDWSSILRFRVRFHWNEEDRAGERFLLKHLTMNDLAWNEILQRKYFRWKRLRVNVWRLNTGNTFG